MEPTTAASIEEQDVGVQVRQGLMLASLAGLPIRGIEYLIDQAVSAAVDTVCSSSDTAHRACKVAERGLSRVAEAVTPTSFIEKIETGKIEIVASLTNEHDIPREDTEHGLGSAGKIGVSLITLGAGGIVIKAGKTALKTLKNYKTHIKSRNAHLPEIEGIRFDAKTARKKNINWGGKAEVQVITVKGSENSILIFIDSLSSRLNPQDQIMKRAFKEISTLLERKKTEHLFLQFLPAAKGMPRLLQRHGCQDLGKFPFELKKFPVAFRVAPKSGLDVLKTLAGAPLNILPTALRPAHKYTVMRVGRKTMRVGIPAITATTAVMGSDSAFASEKDVLKASEVHQAEPAEIESMMRALEDSSDMLVEFNGRMVEQWIGNSSSESSSLAELRRSASSQESPKDGTKAFIDQQSFDDLCGRVHKDTRNLAGIVGSFGNSSTASNMMLVADTAYTMSTELGGLLGLGLATTDPFSATLAIANCVGGLIQAFSKKKKAGQDPLQKQLQAIFAQLETIQNQLEEIDKKAADILVECTEGFSSTFSTLQHHTWQLKQMGRKLDSLDRKVSAQFIQLTGGLQKILGSVRGLERSRSLEDITGQLFLFLDEEETDTERFKERVEFLMKYARHTSKQPSYNRAEMSVSFNPRDYEFSIQTLFEMFEASKGSNLANPTLYTLGTLGILFLTIRQYPSLELPTLSRICSVDLRHLQSLLEEGKALQTSLMTLSQSSSRGSVIQGYNDVSQKLTTTLRKKLEALEQERQGEMYHSARGLQLATYRTPHQRTLFHKKFGISIYPAGTSWFRGGHSVHYTKKGSKMRGAMNEGVAAQRYQAERLASIESSRNRYWSTRVQSVDAIHQHGAIGADQMEMPWLILPKKDASLPALPVPALIKELIPADFKEAAEKGLGVFQIEYEVTAAKKFVLNLDFKTSSNSTRIPISQIEMEYDPRFYSGAEAVWWYWVGGHFAATPQSSVGTFRGDCGRGGGDWKTHMPRLTSQAGMVDKVKLNEVKVVPCSETYPELKALLSKHELLERRNILQRLITDVSMDNEDLVQEFDLSYQKLMGFISLTCKDQLDDPMDELPQTLENLASFSHWSALSNSIKRCESNEALSEIMTKFSNGRRELSRLLSVAPSDNTSNDMMLDVTLGILEFILEYYGPHSVKWNRWNEAPASHEFRDSILKGSLETIGGLLNLAQQDGQVDSASIIAAVKKLHDAAKREHEKLSADDRGQTTEVLKSLLGNMGPLLTDDQ